MVVLLIKIIRALNHYHPKGLTQKNNGKIKEESFLRDNYRKAKEGITMNGIVELLKKSKIPFTVVRIKIDPEIRKQVDRYVQSIENAHKRAGESKLHFGAIAPA